MKKKLWINHGLLALALGAPLLAVISCGETTTAPAPQPTGPKTEAELWDERKSISMNEINNNFSKYYETLPDGTLKVRKNAFETHTLPSEYKLPPNVTVIGAFAFADTNLYKTFVIPEGVTTLEEAAFAGSELFLGFNIPRSVRKIEYYAFAAINNNLGSNGTLPTTFSLPNPVFLGDAVFANTTLFESFGFPAKLPQFSDSMYQITSPGGGHALSQSFLPDNMAWFDKDGVEVQDKYRVTWGASIHAKSWKQGQ